MSTKFNRNDSNAGDDKFYLPDYVADLNGVEQDLRDYNLALHEMPCIISGLEVTVNPGDDDLFDVSAGLAFDNAARRIELPVGLVGEPGADTTDGAINYICIRHKYSYSDSRNAYKTGAAYYTRKYDDYEIVIRTEAQGIQTGDVCLATSTGTGTGITLDTDDRTQPDFSGGGDTTAPMKVTGVTLGTGADPTIMYPLIADQFIDDDRPVPTFVKVTFNEVSDASGIKEYQVELVPLNGSDQEIPEYLTSQTIKYAPTAPGGPDYTPS